MTAVVMNLGLIAFLSALTALSLLIGMAIALDWNQTKSAERRRALLASDLAYLAGLLQEGSLSTRDFDRAMRRLLEES
jgi:hypothetical protein